ncbi:MAG: choline kinase, partial [Gammaproteobacteria bacterium]|nr:choline kinase [Gammaproteobacteria bacterium]
GHNDLLAANFIDDGHRLWLIDWDYAGYNSPLFDLANLAANNEIDFDFVAYTTENLSRFDQQWSAFVELA